MGYIADVHACILLQAQSFGTKQIQEDDLYEMIETRPGKGKPKVKGQTPQVSNW